MKFEEKKMNLFDVPESYYLAHCISADYALGAGIAVEFNKRFGLTEKLKKVGTGVYPEVILIGRVFNLVTKQRYLHKPTLQSLTETLYKMKQLCLEENIKYLAMPRIGCGLDRLNWVEVRERIKEVFSDTDIEIFVCYL